MNRLAGKVAVITGGGSGIGRSASKLFAKEGAQVAVVDVDLHHAKETVTEIVKDGGDATLLQTDVSSKDDVLSMVDKVHSCYGEIDILFNNAGTILPGAIEDIEEESWQRLLDVNLTSMFLCMKYFSQDLKRNKGKVVNMSSMNGLVGQQNNPAYSATKGAIVALTRSLAVDFSPYGVRVNAICPAGVMTPLIEKWFSQQPDPEQMQKASDLSHLLGRTALPEEIANLALYLSSEESSFITGQAIPIEGGATLGYGAGPKAEWETINTNETKG